VTFKLVQAKDQTCLPCEFGPNPFSGYVDISYTNKKVTDSAKKQNLTQFTVCGNNNNSWLFIQDNPGEPYKNKNKSTSNNYYYTTSV